ncbi:hypothetical protein TIFTF001_017572 [Ficus carica]|uniref:Uncharacterized protein n=1 Tax=Ficus carica TaxID=3494 RepID=A0AA88ACG6_FICCA|nr:hypothetical protein TIFTF001_017572 [Ficus carica]
MVGRGRSLKALFNGTDGNGGCFTTAEPGSATPQVRKVRDLMIAISNFSSDSAI